MTDQLKKFRVAVYETRVYEFIIEAATEEAANDIAMSGNLDFDTDSVKQYSLECDVLSITEEP
jgi:hypothetical protein